MYGPGGTYPWEQRRFPYFQPRKAERLLLQGHWFGCLHLIGATALELQAVFVNGLTAALSDSHTIKKNLKKKNYRTYFSFTPKSRMEYVCNFMLSKNIVT